MHVTVKSKDTKARVHFAFCLLPFTICHLRLPAGFIFPYKTSSMKIQRLRPWIKARLQYSLLLSVYLLGPSCESTSVMKISWSRRSFLCIRFPPSPSCVPGRPQGFIRWWKIEGKLASVLLQVVLLGESQNKQTTILSIHAKQPVFKILEYMYMLTFYVSRLSYLPLWFVLIIGVQALRTSPTTGVVVDSGDGVMHYCAVPGFTRWLGIAGSVVTRYLIKLLNASVMSINPSKLFLYFW